MRMLTVRLAACALFAVCLHPRRAALPAGPPGGREAEGRDIAEQHVREGTALPEGVKVAGRFVRQTGQKLAGYGKYWDKALAHLTAKKPFGWLLASVTLGFGVVLLLFGWSFLRAAFVPISAIVGSSAGAFMALEFVVALWPGAGEQKALPVLIIGGAMGALAFVAMAWRVRPLAWMFVAAAPFLVASVLLYPLSSAGRTAAILCAAGGLVAGVAVALRRRASTVISTALLGTLCLTFSWGMLTYLLHSAGARTLFTVAVQNPLALFLCMAVLAFVGADFQFILGARESGPAEPSAPAA